MEIKLGDWESIEIVGKDGQIDRIEKTVNYDPAESVIDILKKNKYQDITISQADGKVYKIKSNIAY